jgi:hypothetical protein
MPAGMRFCIHSCFWALALVGSSAHAQSASPHLPRPTPSHHVTTHRSDGAIFPATAQVPRQQRPKRVLVSGSRQALPARSSWQNAIEPPAGGDYVAPAGSETSYTESTQPLIVVEPRQATRQGQQDPK